MKEKILLEKKSWKLINVISPTTKKFLVLKNIGHDYRLNDDEVASVNTRIMERLAEHL